MSRENLIRALRVIAIPVIAALIIRYVFGVTEWRSLWGVMTLSFLALVPYLTGVLTIYFSDLEKVRSFAYRMFFPWVPIFVFFALTILFAWEGWACWAMILPLFLVFASLGGLTSGYFRLRKSKQTNNLHLSLAVLLPFVMGPIENSVKEIPGFYKAYTYIDIAAPQAKIWSNVTRVREIAKEEDHGRLTSFLQIPRPIRAELDFEGVGAKRAAIFDGGLVFDETVLQYEHEQKMVFSIKANTYQIPSTTFDEHILIGGEFFDVLEGTYELSQISENKYRLHLYSEFKLTTTFNFYASIWGRWIMKDIQENILQVVKERSEAS